MNALILDPDTSCRLLYHDPVTKNLSRGKYHPHPGRRPVFFSIDGTWVCTLTVMPRSGSVHVLPRVRFDLIATSGFAIKRHPRPDLFAIDDHKDFVVGNSRLLLASFRKIMEFQMGCASRGRWPSPCDTATPVSATRGNISSIHKNEA